MHRARAILMTNTTTILGLLPLLLFAEYADANIWNALGFALIGGLASATLFVLAVTPGLLCAHVPHACRSREHQRGIPHRRNEGAMLVASLGPHCPRIADML